MNYGQPLLNWGLPDTEYESYLGNFLFSGKYDDNKNSSPGIDEDLIRIATYSSNNEELNVTYHDPKKGMAGVQVQNYLFDAASGKYLLYQLQNAIYNTVKMSTDKKGISIVGGDLVVTNPDPLAFDGVKNGLYGEPWSPTNATAWANAEKNSVQII